MTATRTHNKQLRLRRRAGSTSGALDRDDLDRRFLLSRKPRRPTRQPDLAIVDLFSGCGGLTIGAIEGARRAGLHARLRLAVDEDPAPLTVLQKTLAHPDTVFSTADLRAVLGPFAEPVRDSERELFRQVPAASLLLAGPPCQGHSTLNNHTRHDDSRNDLYLAVARAARLLEPRAIIIENVGGVWNDRRAAMNRCTAALEELGYEVTARRLDLHTIGVPQKRVRHVLVATFQRSFEWSLPEIAGRSVGWAIDDLVDAVPETPFHAPSLPSPANRKRIDWLFARDAYDLPNRLRPSCHQSDHSYRAMYGRLRWKEPAQTITSGFGSMGQGRYVHPLRPRTLTPHEAARLQFLPDFVRFAEAEQRRTALATMIGNVAPPLLATVLVEALVEQGLL